MENIVGDPQDADLQKGSIYIRFCALGSSLRSFLKLSNWPVVRQSATAYAPLRQNSAVGANRCSRAFKFILWVMRKRIFKSPI